MEHANMFVWVVFAAFLSAILYNVRRMRAGREVFLRRITGLEVVEEVIGQATEQDRPIMFNPGFGGIGIELFCSLAVMGHVVRRAARLSMPVLAPLADPLAYAMAEEYWKDGYAAEGKEGMFPVEDCLRYLSNNQAAYAAGVAGWIKRDKVGANLIFGEYGFEALVIAEAGQQAGAVQIACTPSFFQVPFFVVSCDYTVFGEEFYAAGAYFSRDPVLTGSLIAQDWVKLLLLLVVLAGVASLSLFESEWVNALLYW
jgi:hypothetical protein